MKLLICPDKFKGTLDARRVAWAIARGWRSVWPADKLDLMPISDGGDGFGALLSEMLGGNPHRVRTLNAAHLPCVTTWWWEPNSRTAIVESARTIGLAMLSAGRFHPFELDTFGLGKVLQAAIDKGARRIFVGIGGSATNDAGFGLARSIGWKFLDAQGRQIRTWTKLPGLRNIQPPDPLPKLPDIIVAVDVKNPLLGRNGATRIYGPQKGMRPQDFPAAERALAQLARVTRRHFQTDFASIPGAGAAGGLGFGLIALFGARMKSGMDLFAQSAKLDRRIKSADLVITGEGSIDKSTLMGKGAGYVAEKCKRAGLPCVGIGGVVTQEGKTAFTDALALTDFTGLDQAKARPAFWLRHAAAHLARTGPS